MARELRSPTRRRTGVGRRLLTIAAWSVVGVLIAPFALAGYPPAHAFAYRELGYLILADALSQASASDEAFVLKTVEFVNEDVFFTQQNPVDESTWTDLVQSEGWCDQVARDVAQLVAKRGIPARVVLGASHSFGEVFLAGKWRFYDAQNRYTFRLPSGELAMTDEVGDGQGFSEKYEADLSVLAKPGWKSYKGGIVNPKAAWIRLMPLTESYGAVRASLASAIALYHQLGPWFDRLYQDVYVWRHPELNLVERGRNYELFQRVNKAHACYQEALRSEGLREKARFYLGRLLLRTGAYEQAIHELTRLLEDYPVTKWRTPAHYFLGEAYQQTQQVTAARAHYRKVDNSLPGASRLLQLPPR